MLVGDRAWPAARVREPHPPPSAPAGGIVLYASQSPPPLHLRTSAQPPGLAATVHLSRILQSRTQIYLKGYYPIQIKASPNSTCHDILALDALVYDSAPHY